MFYESVLCYDAFVGVVIMLLFYVLCFLVSILTVSLVFASEWDISTEIWVLVFILWLIASVCLGWYGRRF